MKYYGKEKCKILKQIRAEIAKQNDIEWVVSECKHQGNCRGTCPKCEDEVRRLEAALARREALGKTVAVVGISAGIALSVSGCSDWNLPIGGKEEIAGLMAATDEQTEVAISEGEVMSTESETETEIESESETDENTGDGAFMGDPEA